MVQFNWYCERGGDNDKALTWGRHLINLFFSPKLSTDVLYFSFSPSALVLERSRARRSLLQNEKKNKTTTVYTLTRGHKDYKGLQGVTRGHRGLQEVIKGYKGIEGVYKRLQAVTRGYRGLQGITGG